MSFFIAACRPAVKPMQISTKFEQEFEMELVFSFKIP